MHIDLDWHHPQVHRERQGVVTNMPTVLTPVTAIKL